MNLFFAAKSLLAFENHLFISKVGCILFHETGANHSKFQNNYYAAKVLISWSVFLKLVGRLKAELLMYYFFILFEL